MNRRRFLSTVPAATAGTVAVRTASADPHRTELTYGGRRLLLGATDDVVVGEETTFADGMPLRLILRADGDSSFSISRETWVDGDGTFEASFDLADVTVGATFTPQVRWYQFPLTEAEGRIVDADPDVKLSYYGGVLQVDPESDQTVAGTSDLPAGESLVVRARSSGSARFEMAAETVVEEDATFAITLYFSDMKAGTEFALAVFYVGARRATVESLVVD